jgi:hypothetical protein
VDRARLAILQAEIEQQMAMIENLYAVLEDRAGRLETGGPGYVDSAAYQIHNLYNAVEDLMQLVAKAFENNVTDLSRWHTQLLDRMKLAITGVRPALFQADTAVLLHKLRSFRHFFRHAYGIALDHTQVQENLRSARAVRPLLLRDIAAFLQALQAPHLGEPEL